MVTYNEIFVNNKNVLVLRTDLACAIGLYEALVVNQVEYWLEHFRDDPSPETRAKHFQDGKWWVYNTMEGWQKQIRVISLSTVQRTFTKLKKMGILELSSSYNKAFFDQTLWYTINYDKLKELVDDYMAKAGDEHPDFNGNSEADCITQTLGNGPENCAESAKNVENTHTVNLTECRQSSKLNADSHPDCTNTIDYTPYITNTDIFVNTDDKVNLYSNNKKAISLNSIASPSRAMNRLDDFDVSLKKSLENMKQVVKDEKDYQAMKYLVEYFFSAIALRTDTIHHVLSKPQCKKIYAVLSDRFKPLNRSVEDVTWQIQYYLHDFIPKTDMLTMEHFATDGILQIGDYRMQNLGISDEDIDYRAYYIERHPDCQMAQESRKQVLAPAT